MHSLSLSALQKLGRASAQPVSDMMCTCIPILSDSKLFQATAYDAWVGHACSVKKHNKKTFPSFHCMISWHRY